MAVQLAVPSQFFLCMGCGWIEHEAQERQTCSLCESARLLRISTIDVLATLRSHYRQKHKMQQEKWENELRLIEE